ncbi:TonB-dependent receptor [Opitutus sp. GAS368]|uniref:TonB-dependent receptor n=1 Tax=Opitutus sp. GAS368 TaxID=1882749 RepID=UPI0015616826|nr:TonB-dependent receptor [Opitutus sp. GAS368]
MITLVATLLAAPHLPAQAAGTGVIEGRVQNAVTGDNLNNARVSVRGTNAVALTDEAGYYRLAGVPAGDVGLRVFFTGLDEQEIKVTVTAGGTQTADFKLTSVARYGRDADTMKLDKYVVQATKETNAAAIAVNEQRIALGQKSVVSADQFGTIPDANPGELMKWLPGVSVEYFANNIVGVSVRGLDAVNTEIRFDGMPQASASTTTLGTSSRDRNFEMLGSSSADIARVEIRKLRTPEDSANALGGSINLIRRTAFEYNKSVFTYNALFSSDFETFGLSERDGPRDTKIVGWRPNLKLTWTDPVSKTFGYAITVNHNDSLSQVHWSFPTVNFGNADQAAAAQARVAAGLPLTTASVYNPQFRTEGLHDNPKQDITDSASVKFDWRPTSELKLSYSLSGGRYQERAGDDVRVNWNTGGPSSSVTDAVLNTPLGQPGTNDQHSVYGVLGAGNYVYDLREAWRNGIKNTLANVLSAEWRHGDWTLSAAGSYSTSKHVLRDTADGFFGSTTLSGSTLPNTGIGSGTANPQKITVNLLNRDFTNAQTINAYTYTTGDTAVGAPINWQDLKNSYIGGAVSRPGSSHESIGALRFWAKRSFTLGRNPFNVRVGFDYDEQYRNVQQYDAKLWTFVGADHIAGTADDNAAQIAAVNVAPRRDAYYNFPAVPRLSMRQLYNLYVAHPDWFVYRDAESYKLSNQEPYEILEKKTAPWIEFTGTLLDNRLSYIGGVRYEKAAASGLFALDHGSRYVTNLGLVDGTLAGNMARYVRKGGSGHGANDGYFPSFEANYNLRENLILRIGYAGTKADNRFTRSIIPSGTSTIDLNPVTSGPFSGIALGTVNRSNPNLKPWTADNYEAHLEYYSAQGGVMSIGGYLKEIKDVQVQQTILLDTPAKLAELDLDPSYLNFQSATWVNQGDGEISGLEAEMRQPLDAWLPGFLRGLTFTGSANVSHLAKFGYLHGGPGNVGTDFQNFYEKQFKANAGYQRGKLGANIGAIYYGRVFRQSDGIAASATNPAIIGYRYYPPYTTVDFNLEYAVTRWAKLFISGRNVTNAQKTRYRVVQGAPAWSDFQIANSLGAQYTAGITGSF